MTLEKKATVVSSSVAGILVVIKFVIGILSGSVAVLASAIDSMLDMFVSLFNLFAVNESEKPADDKFNYGRGKVEAIASVIEGSIITTSGLFILYQAIKKLITGESTTYLGISISVMLISLIFTVSLVIFLNYVAKKRNSMVIRADALHYKTDVWANLSILVSLLIIYLTDWHIVDAIMGIAIALYIIYSSFELIRDGVLMLLDVALDSSVVDKIVDIIESEEEVNSFHYLKTRQSGKDRFVDVHLVFDTNISLLRAHQISDRIEERIGEIDSNSSWIINIHLDPYDDSVLNRERFSN